MSIITQMEDEYQEKYGIIPEEKNDILNYIKENFKVNNDKLFNLESYIDHIDWDYIEFEIPLVPKGTPRPRYSSRSGKFYVKGAANYKKLIKEIITIKEVIHTGCVIEIETYQPTPVSQMRPEEIYLAEKGKIRPLSNPDVDNLAKTYLDAVTGHLIINDNIVFAAYLEKYFSMKPRIVITIKYMKEFDSKYNMKKVTGSKSYKSLIGTEKVIK